MAAMESNSTYDEQFDDKDFPPVGEENSSSDTKEKDKRPGRYQRSPNDSLTLASGFINEIRAYVPEGKGSDDTLYFARIGLIQGSEKDQNDKWVGIINNYDVLIGRGLRRFAFNLVNNDDLLKGVRFNFKVRNLTTSADMHENKPVQRSRGVLESAEIGSID